MMVTDHSEQKKTIVFFAHKGGDDHITGAENYLLFLLKEMKERHHCIVVSPLQSMFTVKVAALETEVIITPYPMCWKLWQPDETIAEHLEKILVDPSKHELAGLIKEKQADLVVTNTSVNPLPAIAAKQVAVPVVWIASEVIAENEFTKETVSFIHHYSNWIIGVSNAVLKPFHTENLQRKTFLLHPTIDHNRIQLSVLNRQGELFRHKLRIKKKGSINRLYCCLYFTNQRV